MKSATERMLEEMHAYLRDQISDFATIIEFGTARSGAIFAVIMFADAKHYSGRHFEVCEWRNGEFRCGYEFVSIIEAAKKYRKELGIN